MPAYRDNRTGRWRYRKWIQLPNGKRKRIWGTPPIDTKAAALEAELAHIQRMLHPERAPDPEPTPTPPRKEIPTFREFVKRFMQEYLPRQKPSERNSKNQILNGHLLPFFGALRLDEIDQSKVNAFIATQTVSTKTVNNRLAVLSTVLTYAGPLGCNLIPPRMLRLNIEAMSAEVIAVPFDDVRKLLAACTDDRYTVAILLAAEAGLRIGEVRGLQWGDIRDGWITIRRSVDTRNNVTAPKHNKSRKVPLSPALAAALAKLPKVGLWVIASTQVKRKGDRLGYWAMLEKLHAIYDAAEVKVPKSETGETMPWHSLRHHFGTELAARGVPVPTIKELMGHADIQTTMRYVTISGEQMGDAIRTAFGQQVGNEPSSGRPLTLFSVED